VLLLAQHKQRGERNQPTGQADSFNASVGDLQITINSCDYEMESVRFLVYRDYQFV